MKRTTTLGSLLDLTKNSFNSLCYEDWSTSHQIFVKAENMVNKTVNKNEKKVKSKAY